jgi:hypothetical protein
VRDSALGAIQMPPLAKNMVDTNYINVLGQWINSLNQTPVTAPDLVTRWMSQGVGTPVVNLLTNDFDPDGDGLSLVEVSGSAPAGASLSYSNDWVTYWPPFGNTNAGNFSYIISDGHGGSATGLVNVAVIPDPAGVDVLGIALGTLPAVDVILTGIPGFTYTVQYSDGLQPAVWQNLTNATADGSGTLRILDSHSSVTNRFYRAVRGLAP